MDIIKPAYSWKTGLNSLGEIQYIVLHHAESSKCTVSDIHRWHQEERKWNGIGYNFFVAKDGKVYEGRGFKEGAHCSGYNSVSLGVCLEGSFEKEEIGLKQYSALIDLLKYLKDKYAAAKIVGHRDLGQTACPGKNIDVDKINRSVSVNYPILRKGHVSEDVSFLQVALRAKGYILKIDGFFGPETEKHVKQFQADQNLTIDGVVGNKTWGVLL